LVPLTVNPAWDEQSIFTAHLIDRLFSLHQDPAAPQSTPWILVFFRAKEEDAELSYTSIRALATGYFAKVHRHSDIMRKGAGFYARALRALRTQLQDPQLALEDDVLVAIICMGLYELISFTQPSGWLHHYKGLARLVRAAVVCMI
jgi:Fungal specific transcription factor domain